MIAAMILTLVCVFYRVALGFHGGADWVNFAPVSAIALCGAVFLPRIAAWMLPALILLISDLILNAWYRALLISWEMGIRYGCLAVVIALGLRSRSKLRGLASLLAATLTASVWFYLVTNSISWLSDAAYAKTAAGWWQALTVGLPGFPPTLLFFRNSLLSDLLFTGLFVACISWSRSPAPKPAGSHAFEPSIHPRQ